MNQVVLYGMFGDGVKHLTWLMENDHDRIAQLIAAYDLELGVIRAVPRIGEPTTFYLLARWGKNED